MSAPVFNPSAPTFNLTVGQDETHSFTVNVGGGTDAITIAFTQGGSNGFPPGVNGNFELTGTANNGDRTYTIRFTGSPTQPGTKTQECSVINSAGTSKTTVTFVVANSNNSPTATDAVFVGTVGVPFDHVLPINNWDPDDGTISFVNPSGTPQGLPDGLVFDPQTLHITGTPTTAYQSLTCLYWISGTNYSLFPHLTITIEPVSTGGGGTPSGSFDVEINLLDGTVTLKNGSAFSYFGDQKQMRVSFVPPALAGQDAPVTGCRYTFKEKVSVPQYRSLLADTGNSTDGTNYMFPVVTFAGEALTHSFTLHDEVLPDESVVYSLEFFFTWSGRTRKSAKVDYTIRRPQDLDLALAQVVDPATPGNDTPQFYSGPLVSDRANPSVRYRIGVDNGQINVYPAS